MLNRLVADTDGAHEEDFVDIERPTGRRSYSSRRFRWWYIPLGLLILFPYLSIFALFGMYGNVKKESTTNNVSQHTIHPSSTAY